MKSGIKASVQSWNGSLIMNMSYRGDELYVEIEHSEGSSFSGYTVFRGTVQQLLEKLAS